MALEFLGYNESTSKYTRGPPVAKMLPAADAYLHNMMDRLRHALSHSFSATAKGDAHLYLNARSNS